MLVSLDVFGEIENARVVKIPEIWLLLKLPEVLPRFIEQLADRDGVRVRVDKLVHIIMVSGVKSIHYDYY